jgi:acyl-CoA thioesterase
LYREEPYSDMQEMVKNDEVAKAFGIKLVECGKGWCRFSMVVRKGMLNAYGAAHGSVIYALADVAFAVACNSHGVKGVALSMTMHYRRPACENEQLTAEAREESRGKTTGLYRIKIMNGEGKLVAVAYGLAFLSQK